MGYYFWLSYDRKEQTTTRIQPLNFNREDLFKIGDFMFQKVQKSEG